NRHIQVVLDLLFDRTRAVPVCERKAAVDLGLGSVPRREEIVKLLLRIDYSRVRVSELGRTSQQIALDRLQDAGRLPDQFSGPNEFLHFHGLIATADRYFSGLQIARAKLDAQRHAFLDPVPILHPATEIAAI